MPRLNGHRTQSSGSCTCYCGMCKANAHCHNVGAGCKV
jgi:hypothetical protein